MKSKTLRNLYERFVPRTDYLVESESLSLFPKMTKTVDLVGLKNIYPFFKFDDSKKLMKSIDLWSPTAGLDASQKTLNILDYNNQYDLEKFSSGFKTLLKNIILANESEVAAFVDNKILPILKKQPEDDRSKRDFEYFTTRVKTIQDVRSFYIDYKNSEFGKQVSKIIETVGTKLFYAKISQSAVEKLKGKDDEFFKLILNAKDGGYENFKYTASYIATFLLVLDVIIPQLSK